MAESFFDYLSESPYVAIANKEAEIMMRIATEFGFTSAGRSRISVPTEREPTLFQLAKVR